MDNALCAPCGTELIGMYLRDVRVIFCVICAQFYSLRLWSMEPQIDYLSSVYCSKRLMRFVCARFIII